MTATDRLLLLLPLANRDPLTTVEIRRRIFDFLHGFEARGLRLPKGQGELWDVHGSGPTELRAAAERVARVFAMGLLFFDGPRAVDREEMEPDDIKLPLTFPSLRFGAFSPKSRKRDRFELLVEAGRLRDLVSYLVMYLLATEETRVARCHAPAPRDWKNKCHRVLISSGLGRPRLVCDDACAARVKAKKVNDAARQERKEWQASHPKRSKRHRAAR